MSSSRRRFLGVSVLASIGGLGGYRIIGTGRADDSRSDGKQDSGEVDNGQTQTVTVRQEPGNAF
ncbi:hypothetical protein [Natronosalvus rutilus]|uniref:Uncharacterized protein n=1 Tax=Natronosalvus rutilus TaxID=2953753 RepID=A0A9E7SVG4_9EURY|nr:hypothetical protein [Natronosalvus rutilus]UTF52258.1 hypothetical protein NGM29_10665 [Natronosalvus rutilus]